MKPTLGQVFALSLLGLAAVLAVLFYVVLDASRETMIESSERIRDSASREIAERVTTFLSKAPALVEQFQHAIDRGVLDARNPGLLEPALFRLLVSNDAIGEVTLTYGESGGFDSSGALRLDESPRGQVTVARALDASGKEHMWSRHIYQDGDAFVADRRELEPKGRLMEMPLRREAGAAVADPTAHPTFVTPARKEFYGQLLWSDLHWSQLDAHLPEPQRRVEVSVQQVVTDLDGKFVGVLRVGLLTHQLDRAVDLKSTPAGVEDPHRIFLCDAQGRLITRISPDDRLQESGGDLRVAPASLPAEIATALADTKLRSLGDDMPSISGRFRHGGEEYLTTFRLLPETQDWIAGIVVPRSFYLGKLAAIRDRLLVVLLGIMALLVGAGSLILRAARRAQTQIVKESVRMNSFEFSPASTGSAFRDVSAVLESLEKAKTAMRAMSKYVPVDLVRRLYREKSEPVLGGELREVTIMFTDIKDFTRISEELSPNDLAAALGRYLDVMAQIIQRETRGTIDKYIGDAIMTFWNAPELVANHSRMACLAALRCKEAGHALGGSLDWRGLPPFETRFGIHRDTALIGHFGAPDRMNYTAIGDAVNLASRLEGLNKHYGTTIIASERVVEEAAEYFEFRLLDLVAVKGKSNALKIYELRGRKGELRESRATMAAYEHAFACYAARNFAVAAAILGRQEADPPSAVLLERCRAFQKNPPPPDWRGVHVATSK